MKILFLTYDLPFPLDQGGKIRAYHLIKQLAQRHQVTLFSFYRQEKQRCDIKKLETFCSKIVLFKRMKAFSPRHFLTALRPNFPFPIALYWSPELKASLEQAIVAGNYDLIHYESFYLSLYLRPGRTTPQILGTENIEWQVYQQYCRNHPWLFFRGLAAREVWRMRRFEQKTWRLADACLAVSAENQKAIEKASHRKCYLVPNGVDLDFFAYRPRLPQRPATILFVGNFKYIQNQDAGRFLIHQVMPLLKKKLSSVKLLLVGRQPPKDLKPYVKSDVEDIRQVYQQADILLAPIRAGSGTKFKILEAMASGLPVITTPVGIEGIKARHGREVIVEDKPEAMAAAAINLLNNRYYYQQLGRMARKLVEKNYDWKKIGEQLEKAYQEIIRDKKA